MVQPELVGMVAKDMAATLKFYRTLGLDIPANVDSEPHVEYVTPGGFRIAWDALSMIKDINPDWVEPVGQRLSLAIRCDSPAEVNTLHEKLVKIGYTSHRAPWDAFWGQRYAVVDDPDGNHVDLFAAL
jgi:uncharacterized glyoxalase superfamily protein PhnB